MRLGVEVEKMEERWEANARKCICLGAEKEAAEKVETS